jgi:AcrR family transcriptional regulator
LFVNEDCDDFDKRKFAHIGFKMNTLPTRRQERRDAAANRQRIIQASRELFASKGIEQTTMNEIAQAAQVGIGTLYRRFAHKGEICIALLADDFEQFTNRIENYLREHPQPYLKQLEYTCDVLLAMTVQHVPMLSSIHDNTANQRKSDVFNQPFYMWLHEHICDILRKAYEHGEIIEIETEFVADALLHVLSPHLVHHAFEGRHLTHNRIMNTVRQLFIEGLRRP